MLKWIQGGISAVTGIAEPEYGKEYIHPVGERVEGKQPFHQTTTADFEWRNPGHTNVETVTFYFSDLEKGYVGFAQVIHSSIVGLHTTAQFTFKVYNVNDPDLNVWTSTKLENFRIEGFNFYADDLSIEMNEEGSQIRFKSAVNPASQVDLTFDREAPGVKLGEDPTTYYGDDVEKPWGSMRHVFWPRNLCHGTLTLASEDEEEKDTVITFTEEVPAYSMFVMALQGMKPHHAAKSWNFLNFQSKTHSAVLMQFTTPKSYANTEISVGIICKGDEIVAVTTDNVVEHLNPEIDSVGWPIPKEIEIRFTGIPADVKDEDVESAPTVTAVVKGPLKQLVERVDVMSEIPNFVKNIVSGVAGTKPYIYQYANDFTLKVNDEDVVSGLGWCEVTFISESEEVTEESYSEK
ncbi:LAFE_0D07998g1_1 [Lachancea fermentati]|uniref:LAFE_0D07998g1_1 n=1 Tax=Lachancea fermentati TaxID=4955 RepID=A0A1G4MBH2_LACFM|nr:LAFE_0D07998g1_1 [Lachancea fermentati]